MSEAETTEDGPQQLLLKSVKGTGTTPWTVQLEDDLLSLLSPEGRLIMMLPQEDAARHMRFDRNLRHGGTVSFVLMDGLKAYTFKCPSTDRRALLKWLPQKSHQVLTREIRLYGVALILVGALQLLFQSYFFWGRGLAVLLLGVGNIVYERRTVFAINGIMLAIFGLIYLFVPIPSGTLPAIQEQLAKILATGLGSVFLIWSIQQFSLLGPKQQIFYARAQSTPDEEEVESNSSKLIRKVVILATLLALLLAAHLAGILWQLRTSDLPPSLADIILYAAPMLVLAGATVILSLSKSPKYIEAKLAGQFAMFLAVLYAAGLIAAQQQGLSLFTPSPLKIGGELLVKPYVWLPIIVLVLAFNQWFAEVFERELRNHGE